MWKADRQLLAAEQQLPERDHLRMQGASPPALAQLSSVPLMEGR